jgi:hypothetical protein
MLIFFKGDYKNKHDKNEMCAPLRNGSINTIIEYVRTTCSCPSRSVKKADGAVKVASSLRDLTRLSGGPLRPPVGGGSPRLCVDPLDNS